MLFGAAAPAIRSGTGPGVALQRARQAAGRPLPASRRQNPENTWRNALRHLRSCARGVGLLNACRKRCRNRCAFRSKVPARAGRRACGAPWPRRPPNTSCACGAGDKKPVWALPRARCDRRLGAVGLQDARAGHSGGRSTKRRRTSKRKPVRQSTRTAGGEEAANGTDWGHLPAGYLSSTLVFLSKAAQLCQPNSAAATRAVYHQYLPHKQFTLCVLAI